MSISITTSGDAAVAAVRRRYAPRAKAGQVASSADVRADLRAEARVSTAMAVNVRTEQGETPGCIRSVSSRGIMLSMARPRRRGEFLEIVTGGHSLIGQVRWVSECRAGLALREPIDVGAFLSGQPAAIAAKPKPVRKAMSVPAVMHIPRDSHIVARQLQFAAIIAFGVVAACMIAVCVNDLLSDVVSQVSAGLPG